MNSTRLARSRRRRESTLLLLCSALLAVAWLTSPAEGSLPRAGLQDANPAVLAGAEAVDSGRFLTAGLETQFSLITVDDLEEALACNPGPEAGGLNLIEGLLLEPPDLVSRACEGSFSLHLEPVDFGQNPQPGPPVWIPEMHQGWFVAEPKTRIGGFGLNLEDLIGDECPLTLGLRRGYAVEGWGIAEEERPDPWGLFELNDVWKAVKTYVEVGLDTTRGNLKSAARLGLGMADAAAGGRIMGAARALDSAASTKGSAGERLAAAYGAYERGKRATMSMGFSEAADKLQHAQDLVGVGGIDRGSSQLAEGILEGDLDKAGRGLAEFVGGAGQLAGTAAAVYAPFAPKAAPGAQMNLSAGNPRNNVPLTETQMAEVRAYTQEVRITDDAMQFYSGDTAYVPNWDTLLVGPDVFPGPAGAGPAGTLGANARIGMRGALSHEIVGHRAAAQAGRTNASSVLEEAQASIRAARFGPGLTASERFVLLRDAVARLAKEGIKVKDVKDQLWIQAP